MFFSYEIIPPVDEFYGTFVNNSWNGLIGMVHRGVTHTICFNCISKFKVCNRKFVIGSRSSFNTINNNLSEKSSCRIFNSTVLRNSGHFNSCGTTSFISLRSCNLFQFHCVAIIRAFSHCCNCCNICTP